MANSVVLQPMKDSSASKLGHTFIKEAQTSGRHYGFQTACRSLRNAEEERTALVSYQAHAMSTRMRLGGDRL